jgi:thiol-disulfide isomerase/thioredoxin
VVLNFWASWCSPCRKEFPYLREQLAAHNGEFAVLGVDNRDIDSDARAFAKKQGATWPNAVDATNGVWKAYGTQALPQTFFISPAGNVAERLYGQLTPKDFEAALAKITSSPKS